MKLPNKIFGIDTEGAYQKYLEDSKKSPPEGNQHIDPVEFDKNIVKSDYIQIPNQGFIMAIAETCFNLNYEDANKAVLKRSLEVPDANQFMAFHNYVIDCYKNKKKIFDADGNPVSYKTRNDLYKELTEDCWTWLNGKFHIKRNKSTIEKISGLDADDNLLARIEKLKPYLEKNCYIDFKNLNKQGFPNKNAEYPTQSFVKGENIYFYKPENNAVARFSADSGGVYFSCFRDPEDSYSSLGVRPAHENI